MPKILVNVSEGQKSLWVAAAHDERVSLSEWIRRRCDGGLTAGADERPGESVTESVVDPFRVASTPERPPAVSSFRPDPKRTSK
jgi:hypothetical protein